MPYDDSIAKYQADIDDLMRQAAAQTPKPVPTMEPVTSPSGVLQTAKPPAPPQPQTPAGVQGGVMSNLFAGTAKAGAQTISAASTLVDLAGEGLQAIGADTVGSFLSDVGETSYQYYKQQLADLEKVNPSGDITKNPRLLLDPGWWAQSLGQAATSISQAMTLGGTTIIGAALAGAAMEAAPMYEQMKEEGVATPEALTRAVAFGAVVAALERVGLKTIFKGKPPKVVSKLLNNVMKGKGVGSALARRGVSAGIEAATEWAEEPSQALLQYLGREGVSLTDTGKQVFAAMKQGINVIPATFVTGGVLGGGERVNASLTPEDATQALNEEMLRASQELEQQEGPAPAEPQAPGPELATPQEQPAPEKIEQQDAIANLRTRVEQTRGNPLPDDQFTATEKPQRKDANAAEQAAEVFGKKIVWFRNNHPENIAFHGSIIDDTVFVNTESENPVHAVVLHESVHRMRETSPDLYEQLLTVAQEEGSGFQSYLGELNEARANQNLAPLSEEAAWEEFIADTVAEEGMNEGFWQDLYERSPKAVQALVDTIRTVIETLSGSTTDAQTSAYLEDVQRVYDTATSVMSEYAQREQTAREQQTAAEPVEAIEQAPEPAITPEPSTPSELAEKGLETPQEDQRPAEPTSKPVTEQPAPPVEPVEPESTPEIQPEPQESAQSTEKAQALAQKLRESYEAIPQRFNRKRAQYAEQTINDMQKSKKAEERLAAQVFRNDLANMRAEQKTAQTEAKPQEKKAQSKTQEWTAADLRARDQMEAEYQDLAERGQIDENDSEFWENTSREYRQKYQGIGASAKKPFEAYEGLKAYRDKKGKWRVSRDGGEFTAITKKEQKLAAALDKTYPLAMEESEDLPFSISRDLIDAIKQAEDEIATPEQKEAKWLKKVSKGIIGEEGTELAESVRQWAEDNKDYTVKHRQETREGAEKWIDQQGVEKAFVRLTSRDIPMKELNIEEQAAAAHALFQQLHQMYQQLDQASPDAEYHRTKTLELGAFLDDLGRQMGRGIDYFNVYQTDLTLPGAPERLQQQSLDKAAETVMGEDHETIIKETQAKLEQARKEAAAAVAQAKNVQAEKQQIVERMQKELRAAERQAANLARAARTTVGKRYASTDSVKRYSEVNKQVHQEAQEIDRESLLKSLRDRAAQAKLSLTRRLKLAIKKGSQTRLSDEEYEQLVVLAQDVIATTYEANPRAKSIDVEQQIMDALGQGGPLVEAELPNIIQNAWVSYNALLTDNTRISRKRKAEQTKEAAAKPEQLEGELKEWAVAQGLDNATAEKALAQAREQAKEAAGREEQGRVHAELAKTTLRQWAARNGLTGEQADAALNAMRLEAENAREDNLRGALETWARENNISTDATQELFSGDVWTSIVAAKLANMLAPSTSTRTLTDRDRARIKRGQFKRMGAIQYTLKEMGLRLDRIVNESYLKKTEIQEELVNRLVGELGLSQQEAERLAWKTRKEFRRQIEAKSEEMLDRIFLDASVNRRDLRDVRAVAQLIKYMNAGVLTQEKYFQAFAEQYGLKHITPEMARRLQDLQRKVIDAPEGWQKKDATTDLLAEIARNTGISTSDKIWSIWYSNLLSGYQTHQRNLVDTWMNMVAELGVHMVTHPRSAKWGVYGFLKAVPQAVDEFVSKAKTGKSTVRLHEKYAGAPQTLELDPFTGKLKFLNNWKYVMRLMIAEDILAYKPSEMAHAYMAAADVARLEGKRGRLLAKRISEIMSNTTRQRQEAREQATKEGLTGRNRRRRIYEIMEQNIPSELEVKRGGRTERYELMATSHNFASKLTYNYPAEGILGVIANHLKSMTQKAPVPLRAVVPFTNIVANVANRKLDWTPWGFARLAFGGMLDPNTGKVKSYTHDEKLAEFVKATTGSLAMLAILLMDSDVDDDPDRKVKVRFHGAGSRTRQQQYQQRETGWKPHSIEVEVNGKKHFFSYLLTPCAVPLSIMGNYVDFFRYQKPEEAEKQTRREALEAAASFATVKGISAIADMSFLSSVMPLMEAISMADENPQGAVRNLERIISRTATSGAVPNLVKQIDRLFDPTIKDAYSESATQQMLEYVWRDTPIAQRALKPKLNALGEPAKFDTGIIYGEDRSDPIWNLIVRKQAWIPVPQSTMKIAGEVVTEEEYYEFVKIRGNILKRWIERHKDLIERVDNAAAKEIIRDLARDAGESAKRQVYFNVRKKR